jgi:hypothetical protein
MDKEYTKDKADQEAYNKLLPGDWATMTFSDKIEFTLKVQHAGFKKFILDNDTKLKTYLGKLKDKNDPRLKLYITLFTVEVEGYTPESISLLKDFVDALNNLGRAKLQFVECKNPDMIEIREIR